MAIPLAHSQDFFFFSFSLSRIQMLNDVEGNAVDNQAKPPGVI
jgi:hypothetical protein